MNPDPVKNAIYNPGDFRSGHPVPERPVRTAKAASRRGFRTTQGKSAKRWLQVALVAGLVGVGVYLWDFAQASRALPLPVSGELQRFYAPAVPALAPFTVNATQVSDHYLVKLEDWVSGAPVVTVFVRKGEVASLRLPVGKYRLKFASGKYWMGPRALFGPMTSASEARDPMVFSQQGSEYQGHVVDLLPRVSGNLKADRVLAPRF